MDYQKLSINELEEVIARAEFAINEHKAKRIEELRNEILELANRNGLSINDLFPLPGRQKVKAKTSALYRDPENPDRTWSGRGRKPKWLIEFLDNGGSLDNIKI